jgi:hypothetical protein
MRICTGLKCSEGHDSQRLISKRYAQSLQIFLPNCYDKVLSTTLGQSTIPPSLCIAVAGCGKLFVGDMVERGT